MISFIEFMADDMNDYAIYVLCIQGHASVSVSFSSDDCMDKDRPEVIGDVDASLLSWNAYSSCL